MSKNQTPVATEPKQAHLPAEVSLDAWGEAPRLNAQDIIIPKILLMQGLSDLVADGKAMMGDFRDSLSGAKLGSIVEPIEIIPFHLEKFIDIEEDDGEGNFKWARTEPLIEDPLNPKYNDNLPWTDTIDGLAVKRVRRMNFFCVLPADVKSFGAGALPYVLSFKSTSFREGKKMYTQMFMRNRAQQLPPNAFTFKVGGEKVKNDKGTFIVPSVELGRRTDTLEYTTTLDWFKKIKKDGVRVDDSDVADATTMDDTEITSTGAF